MALQSKTNVHEASSSMKVVAGAHHHEALIFNQLFQYSNFPLWVSRKQRMLVEFFKWKPRCLLTALNAMFIHSNHIIINIRVLSDKLLSNESIQATGKFPGKNIKPFRRVTKCIFGHFGESNLSTLRARINSFLWLSGGSAFKLTQPTLVGRDSWETFPMNEGRTGGGRKYS